LKEHPADSGRRVDALVEHDEVHTPRLQLRRECNQVRSSETIELGDDELVARARCDQ
jgi:hypothetical protein